MSEPPLPEGVTPDEVRRVRLNAWTALLLAAVLAVVIGVFTTPAAMVFGGALCTLAVVRGIRVLRNPVDFAGTDVDAIARRILASGALPAGDDEDALSLRIRLQEEIERLRATSDPHLPLRRTLLTVGVIALTALTFAAGFPLWLGAILPTVYTLYLVADRLEEHPGRVRATEARALLETQWRALGADALLEPGDAAGD